MQKVSIMSEHWNTKSAIRGKRKRLLEVLHEAEKETVEQICKKAGISRDTYYRYIKDPKFQEILTQSSVNACLARTPKIVRTLLDTAENGDSRQNIQAIRTALEFAGFLKSGNSQTVNVGVQAGETTTATYANDQEALEDIETSIKELQGYAQEIKARLNNNNRLRDGIHPEPGGKDREEA